MNVPLPPVVRLPEFDTLRALNWRYEWAEYSEWILIECWAKWLNNVALILGLPLSLMFIRYLIHQTVRSSSCWFVIQRLLHLDRAPQWIALLAMLFYILILCINNVTHLQRVPKSAPLTQACHCQVLPICGWLWNPRLNIFPILKIWAFDLL